MWFWLSQSFRYYNTFSTDSVLCSLLLQTQSFVLYRSLDSLYWTQSAWKYEVVKFLQYLYKASPHRDSRLFLYIIHSQTRSQDPNEPRRPESSRTRLHQHIWLYESITSTTYIMSRYNTQLIAPGMSSGRSRGSSLGQGGFSSTTQTTTVKITTTNTIHHSGNRIDYSNEYTHFSGGSSSAHGHLCMRYEEDYNSDSSDNTVVGRFSNMRLGGRTDSESTIRGPRVIELLDSRSRTSSRPSGSHYSTSSRTTNSNHPTSRTSLHPSESHYSTSRPTDSHRRSTLSSYRPSEPRIYEEDRQVAVYAEPSSNEKGSTDKTKSSRRDSKALKGIKALVKHIWSVGKLIMGSKERWVIGEEFKKVCIWWETDKSGEVWHLVGVMVFCKNRWSCLGVKYAWVSEMNVQPLSSVIGT